MSDAVEVGSWPRFNLRTAFTRLIAKPGFQSWAARFFLTRGQARADGAQLFDIVQGFVSAQALQALIELDVFDRLQDGPLSPEALGRSCSVPTDRMRILLQAGAALGLLRRQRDARYGLARKGAAILGVPGLKEMIRHHSVFYQDLRDPVALLRGAEDTALSRFWPYVFGGEIDPADAAQYSQLMAKSQTLVAEDTLAAISLRGVRHMMDVGGGTGAFIRATAERWPDLRFTLFDLPDVVQNAVLPPKSNICPGSFRTDALPGGADAISLIRVLYDHPDEVVTQLLAKVYDALAPGGRLIISEPMSGGATPDRAGDVYFAFYTLAMQTGRARSAEEITALCEKAGFQGIQSPRPARNYVTRALVAHKP